MCNSHRRHSSTPSNEDLIGSIAEIPSSASPDHKFVFCFRSSWSFSSSATRMAGSTLSIVSLSSPSPSRSPPPASENAWIVKSCDGKVLIWKQVQGNVSLRLRDVLFTASGLSFSYREWDASSPVLETLSIQVHHPPLVARTRTGVRPLFSF
jgi:hypothetical protein